MENVFTRKDPLLDVINQVVLGEKKLTDAELKKREEIAQAIERENPGMDMGKKMAIATAQAKKVAEAYAHDGDNFDYKDSERGAAGVIHPDKAKHYKVGEHAFFYDHGTGNRVAGKVMKKDSKQIHIKHIGKIKKFKISRTHTPQADDFDESVEQIEEGRYLRYDGHVNGKHYSVHVPEHMSIGDYRHSSLHRKIAKENPHLHPHEVKAIVHSEGEEDSHVKVTHGGKTYTHHVYNEPEPDYVHESVEQIDEDYEDAYAKHMNAHVKHAEKGNWDAAEMHAKKAEHAAAKHFKATGKKIRDAGYTGDSPHIVAEEVDLEESNYKSHFKVRGQYKDKDGNHVGVTHKIKYVKDADHAKRIASEKVGKQYKDYKAIRATPFYEEVEQIDELSKGTLGKYISKAVVDVHNDAKWAGETDDRDAKNKAFKRLLGVKSAAARLSKQNVSGGRISNFRREEVEQVDETLNVAKKVKHSLGFVSKGEPDHKDAPKWATHIGRTHEGAYHWLNKHSEVEAHDKNNYFPSADKTKFTGHMDKNKGKGFVKKLNHVSEEVNLEEQLENFWGAYLTCLDEAKDDASQQALLLRAMAKDPSDLMKMKRAIAMGDKALTNPVMRQEILKMLDQMMNLTVTDKALLQKTRSSFMKQKQFKAADTTNTEEYVPEEAEELDELSKGTLNKYVRAAADGPTGVVRSKDMASRFSNPYVKDFMNNRAEKRIKGINTAMKKLNKLTKEEVEELDELSKDTLGNYIKKAATGMNGMAVHAHMSGSASSAEQREKHFDKAFKRGKGISKAADKLTKEEVEELDELSKKTLSNYIKTASRSMHRNTMHGYLLKVPHDRPYSDQRRVAKEKENHIQKSFKRLDGIQMAANKLAKEEVEELDELSKGTIGSYVKKATSDVVNKAVGYSHDAAKVSSKAPPTRTDSDYDKLRVGERRMAKRSKGIDLAVKKLTKEEADKDAPFDGGREVKSSKPAAERVKKIAKGMQKHYTKDKK